MAMPSGPSLIRVVFLAEGQRGRKDQIAHYWDQFVGSGHEFVQTRGKSVQRGLSKLSDRGRACLKRPMQSKDSPRSVAEPPVDGPSHRRPHSIVGEALV